MTAKKIWKKNHHLLYTPLKKEKLILNMQFGCQQPYAYSEELDHHNRRILLQVVLTNCTSRVTLNSSHQPLYRFFAGSRFIKGTLHHSIKIIGWAFCFNTLYRNILFCYLIINLCCGAFASQFLFTKKKSNRPGMSPATRAGHSVRPNRSVRFLGLILISVFIK